MQLTLIIFSDECDVAREHGRVLRVRVRVDQAEMCFSTGV